MFGAKRTRLETLERRSLLAADASVAVFGGNLFIQGSDANETVDIETGAEAGSFTISGVDAGMLGDISSRFDDNVTTNADGSVTVTGVNHGVHINLRGGDDTLRLRDIDLSGNLHINTGAGDDTVVIGADSAGNTGDEDSSGTDTDDGNSTDDASNTDDATDGSGPIGGDSNTGDSTDDNSNSDDGTNSGDMTNDDVGSIGDDSSGDNSGDSVDNNSTGDDSVDDTSGSTPDDANSDDLGTMVASTGDTSVDDSAADAFDDSSMTTTTVDDDSSATNLSNVSSGDDTTAGDANMGEGTSDTTVTSDTGPLRPSIDTVGRFDNIARLLENIQNRAARGDRFFDRIYDRFQDANLGGNIDPNRLQQVFDRLGIPDFPADNFDPDQVNAIADRFDLSNADLNGLRQGIHQLVAGLPNNGSSNDDGSDDGLSPDDSTAADASVSVDRQLMINTGAGDDTVTVNSLNVANQLRIEAAAGDDHVSIDSANVDRLMASLGAGSDVFDLVGSKIDGLTRLMGGDGVDTLNNATSNSFGRLIHRGFEPPASNV